MSGSRFAYPPGSGTAGVSSISVTGDPQLTGDVTLSEGSNITLTQVGNDIEIASTGGGGGGTVDSVVGTTNRITVDSTDPTNPIVDIASTYVGQNSITTLGTITTGVWNATDIAPGAGGTGVSNTGTITVSGNTSIGSSTHTVSLSTSGNTSVTLPTTGTLATLAGSETLTNKTINGSSNTLTVLAGSQLSGQVPLASGGTGANLSDPGADRILFWDDSNSTVDWLTVGTGLSISGTTITATGGTGDVVGPASSTDNAIARFDLTTGKIIQDSLVTINDSGDIFATSIYLDNNDSGAGARLVAANSLGFWTATFQNITGNVVIDSGTQTLTNKTLTSPVISTISNTGTLTLPTSTDTLVGRATTDTLTNKTISGSNNTISNIGNSSLTNSSVTIGSTSVALGATAATIAGLTLTTPTIASFTNATHNHTNAAGGGQLTDAALSTAVTVAKGGTGVATLGSGNVLVGAGTGNVTSTKAAPSGDFVGTTDSQTLTNKTINGSQLVDSSVSASKLNLGAQTTQRNTASTTTSTSYTSTLADGFTDSVTVTVGANGMALVSIFGILSNSGNNYTSLAFAISGATTRVASDFRDVGNTILNVIQVGATFLETGLNPGSTTFTLQYRVGGGTGTFNGRMIAVVPL